MKTKTAIIVALLVLISCVASLGPSVSAQCDHNLTVASVCCDQTTTEGWFFNGTDWNYSDPTAPDYTPLFHLVDNTDGREYDAFCNNYEVPLYTGDTFNASVYSVLPSCKNNSIAYILNEYTIDCSQCVNVCAGQSAVWYFAYIDETFCDGGIAGYDHTTTPPLHSNWIPDCTAHPEACAMINDSIGRSVPYGVSIAPNTGSFTQGVPLKLEATVVYCEVVTPVVTVEFETDNGIFENGASVFSNTTVNGKARATLTCNDPTATVTAQVTDYQWLEIVDPIGCNAEDYQPTIRFINITDDAAFNFGCTPPDIQIVKLVNQTTVERNDTVLFTLNITNIGTTDVVDPVVVDVLPEGLTWADSATPEQDVVAKLAPGPTTIKWDTNLPGGILVPGASFEITFLATIDPDAIPGEAYTNCATVNVTSEPYCGYADDTACATVWVKKPPQVPVLTPFGIAALIGLLSLVMVLNLKSVRRKRD